jgi:heterodisulfide reductase subunit A
VYPLGHGEPCPYFSGFARLVSGAFYFAIPILTFYESIKNRMMGDIDMTKNVLVIGAGIAGIQASLDLADADIKVYLVEREPSIGGKMAQLDKTFPTNDCAI